MIGIIFYPDHHHALFKDSRIDLTATGQLTSYPMKTPDPISFPGKINLHSLSSVAITCTLLLLIILTGCKSYFVAVDFDTRTANHKTIAILPFEMIFTGVKPEKLTQADMDTIAVAESKAFMISFYNEVLRSTRSGRDPIRVDVQHFDKTLSLLQSHNMAIRSSWTADPGQLAQLLGVDAVVKSRIEKHRLMSDLASYGIDMGMHILGILSNNAIWFWLPSDLAKSNEIKSNCSLVDDKGTTLWSISFEDNADWSEPANKIIDNINRRSAKNFPYRSK